MAHENQLYILQSIQHNSNEFNTFTHYFNTFTHYFNTFTHYGHGSAV